MSIFSKKGDVHLAVIGRGDIEFVIVRRRRELLLTRRNENFSGTTETLYTQVEINEGEAAEIIGLRTNKMRFAKCRAMIAAKTKHVVVT